MKKIFKFDDEIHAYQRFVRENIKKLGNLVIISEQLLIKHIEKGFIDVLTIDIQDKRLCILELKNVEAGDAIVGQAIKYYDFLSNAKDGLKKLLQQKKHYFNFDIEEINYNPKIMLIVPDFSSQLLRSLSYIHGIDIEVIKFNAIQEDNCYKVIKENYIPNQKYHNEKPVKIDNKISKIWNFDEYLKYGIEKQKIDLAKEFVYFMDYIYKDKQKKIDIFFYENKITLMLGKKVIANVKIPRKWFDYTLEISIPISQDKNNLINNLRYTTGILKYDFSGKRIKMKVSQLPKDFIKDII